MDSNQLYALIRQGGSARERAIRLIHQKFFYLVRQVGVLRLHLSYEEAAMVYADAVTELDWLIQSGEEVEDLGKMLYALTHRRGVDALRKRTTKTKVEPLSRPQQIVELPQWLSEALQQVDDNKEDEESEAISRQERTLLCIKMLLEAMPPKRRALLVDKLDGYDYEEIVQLHGFKNTRVAHEMVSRALESLRTAVREACQKGSHAHCRALCAQLRRLHLS